MSLPFNRRGRNEREEAESQQLAEQEDRSGLLRSLLAGLMGETPQAKGPGMIGGVSFEKLIQYILSERSVYPESEESTRQIRDYISKVSVVSRDYIDTFVRDGLARIIHPLYGSPIIDARLSEIAQLLRHTIRQLWHRVIQAIRTQAPPEEVYRYAREAEDFSRMAYLLIVEIYAKMLSLYHINAPARLRPPLANVALGYDLVD